MLNHLHIENYKCLRDVTVGLGPFTLLIGSNDSGKSSILEVIERLGEVARRPFDEVFAQNARSLDRLLWNREADRTLVWEVGGTVGETPFSYHIELTAGQRPVWEWLEYGGKRLFWTEEIAKPPADSQLPPGTVVHVETTDLGQQRTAAPAGRSLLSIKAKNGDAPFVNIAAKLGSCNSYRFDPSQLRRPAVPQAGGRLAKNGSNLAGVLDLLQNAPDRSAFEKLQKLLREALPAVQGIVLPPVRPDHRRTGKRATPAGAKELEFILTGETQPPVSIPADLAADGVLLLTAYLTLLYSPTPEILLFEEPQNGIHTSRLRFVMDLLRKISMGAVDGRKRQVIITSHSPLLLSYAKPEEVRVFVRHPELGTQVRPMQEVPDIDQALSEFGAT